MTKAVLRRELGLGGAVVTGLGSILGTGAFVSIGLASGMWGDVVLWAIPIAALLAIFNGLSSASLAGRFPIAGGTYEYAYRTLGPWPGFAAGWLFLLAKTASAASAALGIALYLDFRAAWAPLAAVTAVTLLIISGLRRTTWVNMALVTITIAAIIWFAASNAIGAETGISNFSGPEANLVIPTAVAFLFVAYTGYGRIATLGEEVTTPERTIPRAILLTVAIAALLYLLIALGGRAAGGPTWGNTLSMGLGPDPLVRLGAVTAMAGVLLNLILGLSRVWLAMGRRGDMPGLLGDLDRQSQPATAVLVSGALVAATTLIGDIELAWSFSAMTVLLYYGITNLAALAIDRTRITSWAGLLACVGLSFFVSLPAWLAGAGLAAAGLAWRAMFIRKTGIVA